MTWELDLDLSDVEFDDDDAFSPDSVVEAAASLAATPEAVSVFEYYGTHKRGLDLEAHTRNLKFHQAVQVAKSMWQRGLLTESALAEFAPFLWDKVAREKATKAQTQAANAVMVETLQWITELNPPLHVVMQTGLASVQLAKLGTSDAASASRKIRDWFKVTRYTHSKAVTCGDKPAYIRALDLLLCLLKGFLNTRYWAIAENQRSVEDRALGGQNCSYTPVGAPKSAYRLVVHNQMGVEVSASLKRAEPVYNPPPIESPEHPTGDIQPFPKVQYKKKRWQG